MAATTVSVVMPVLNGAAYVEQALGSVAGQRRRPDEVIVVDDGSSDGTAEVVRRWGDLLPLRVLRHESNRGCWAARATAIEATEADLVALLDGDDVWLPDHLQLMLEAYERRPGLITANALAWVPGAALARTTWDDPRPVPPPGDQLAGLLHVNYVFISALFRREDCQAVGGFRRWPAGCEDWDLWLRMVAAGATITRVGEPTVLYRRRAESMSANDALLDTEIEVLERFKQEHPGSPALRAADAAIGRRRAKQHLRAAFTATAAGHKLRARGHALRAVRRAHGDVRLAAVAATLAPELVRARAQRLRADAAWVVSR